MKKVLFPILAAMLIVWAPATSLAAKSLRCTVTSVKAEIVTLDCGGKAAELKTGTMVKIKQPRKKAIEGC